MHLSVEGLRPWEWLYPVLQYLREWPTPTVIIFDIALSLNPNIHPWNIAWLIDETDYYLFYFIYSLESFMHAEYVY